MIWNKTNKARMMFGIAAAFTDISMPSLLQLARDAEVESRRCGDFDEAVRINHLVCRFERAGL